MLALQLSSVSYQIDDKTLFKKLNFTLGHELCAMVGVNGSGKSTLLRMIAGLLQPDEGKIVAPGCVAYVPQVTYTAGQELSAGMLTMEHISRALATQPDLLLLDEPSNHLDIAHKKHLFDLLRRSRIPTLIVSHERELLEQVDRIVELHGQVLQSYGGNYSFYVEEKARQEAARTRQIEQNREEVRQVKNMMHASLEKQQKRAKYGDEKRRKGSQPKIAVDWKKEFGDHTRARLQREAKQAQDRLQQRLDELLPESFDKSALRPRVPEVWVPERKTLLRIERLSFGYDKDLFSNLNFELSGPQRICLTGPNGSGKSTLAKLILGKLKPHSGSIHVLTPRVGFFEMNALLQAKSAVDWVKQKQPTWHQGACREYLAHYQLVKDTAERAVAELSGGELVRLALAGLFVADAAPELLILDEPSNHLDFKALEILERALAAYHGAILLISHDRHLREAIDCEEVALADLLLGS